MRRAPRRAPDSRSFRSLGHWAALGVALLGVAGLLVLRQRTQPDPAGHGTHEQLGLEPCGWLAEWGVPCPGCGVTTSLSLFAHGRLAESAATQPLGFALGAGALGLFVLALAWTLTGRDLGRSARHDRWAPWVLAGALGVTLSWVYKLAQHLRLEGP